MRLTIITKTVGLSVFSYILLLSLSYSHRNSPYQPFITFLVGISLWFCIKIIIVLDQKYGTLLVFLGVLFIGGLTRFLWAFLVPTDPISDFLYFHDNALKLSQGVSVLTKNMGYSLLLSAGYRVYYSVLTGKLINALASTLSILVLYFIGSKLISKKAGLIAAFIFSLLPSEILMVSVLGTEIIATTIGLCIALLIFSISNNKNQQRLTVPLLAGIFYGLGLAIRSSYIFYLPAILLWLVFVVSSKPTITAKIFGSFSIGVIIGLSLIVWGYYLISNQLSLKPLGTQDSFPFLSGTNTQSSGMWSQEDANLYFSWPLDERDQRAKEEAVRRIISNPKGFLLLIPKKIFNLMGPNDYGSYWSLHNIDWGNLNLLIGLFSQAVYVIIWLFALHSFKNFGANLAPMIVLVLVFFTLIPHIILEAQGRYHHYLMPFIILLAAYGTLQMERANPAST